MTDTNDYHALILFRSCRTTQSFSSTFLVPARGPPLPSSDVQTCRRRRHARAALPLAKDTAAGGRAGGRRRAKDIIAECNGLMVSPGELGRGHALLSIVQDERAYIHQRIDLDIKRREKLLPVAFARPSSPFWGGLNCRSSLVKMFRHFVSRRDDCHRYLLHHRRSIESERITTHFLFAFCAAP